MKRKNSKVVAESVRALRPSLLALAVSQMMVLPVTDAATISVTTASTDPSSGCTLNEAIITANTDTNTGGCVRSGSSSNDTIDLLVRRTITFSAGFDGEPGNEGTAIPFVGSNITIQGRGSTIERDVSAPDFRLLTVFSRDAEGYQGQLTLKDLTIQNGYTQYNGGAIYVLGELNLENTTISSNTSTYAATQGGGAIFVRGSDNTFTSLNSSVTVTDSIISSNTARNGGGILVEANTTTTLINSTVSGNSVNSRGGGIWAFDSRVTLTNSTVIGNSTRTNGGGIYARDRSNVSLINSTVSGNLANERGGGIFSSRFSSVGLNNSTVSGNSASNVGGIDSQSSSLTLVNSTVSGNSANFGSSIFIFGGSTLSLTNSIVANSSNELDCDFDPSSSITANEHNIIEDDSRETDALNVDPRLGPLQDNGGRTQTHALLVGSQAINTGLNSLCNAAPISRLDQRGYLRTGVCDIGAFEFGASLPPPPPPPPPFKPANIVPSVNLLLDDDDLND